MIYPHLLIILTFGIALAFSTRWSTHSDRGNRPKYRKWIFIFGIFILLILPFLDYISEPVWVKALLAVQNLLIMLLWWGMRFSCWRDIFRN